jgi:hypothetical protein
MVLIHEKVLQLQNVFLLSNKRIIEYENMLAYL